MPLPILFVHGFPLDATMWDAQVAKFGSQRQLFVPNLPGFGGVPARSDETTMAEFADYCASILDEYRISEPIVFCGLSMGGYIGWQFYKRHRNRLAGLIQCDTRAVNDEPEIARARRVMAEQVLAQGTSSLPSSLLPRQMHETNIASRPDLVSHFRAMVMRADPSGIAAAQRGMAQRESVENWLSEIDCPVQIIVGEHDRISPVAEMKAIASKINQVTFTVVKNSGHLPPLENPHEFNKVIEDFLQVHAW